MHRWIAGPPSPREQRISKTVRVVALPRSAWSAVRVTDCRSGPRDLACGWRGDLRLTSDESVLGSVGLLIVATRGVAGAGEVILKVRGGSEAYLAWSVDPLPKGTH